MVEKRKDYLLKRVMNQDETPTEPDLFEKEHDEELYAELVGYLRKEEGEWKKGNGRKRKGSVCKKI